MLTHLDIRDFAIIDHISLELRPGMTVLTGETGAGKSILGDALGLTLGERGAGSVVRAGASRAELIAEFDTTALPTVRAWLAGQSLEQPDQECILRRSVSPDGRSRAFINGRPVPLQSLRELGDMLVDIHGQHAHQSLLRRDAQRDILDAYAGHAAPLEALRQLYRRWQQVQRELASLGGSRSEQQAEEELLRYQVEELRGLALEDGEVATLDEEHVRLSNAGRLLQGAQRALHTLDADEGAAVLPLLEAVRRDLEALIAFDEGLGPARELLETAAIQTREAAAELSRYAEGVDLDPQRLDWVEQRIAEIHQLARKHRIEPVDLPEHLSRLEVALRTLQHGDERRRELEAAQAQTLATYREQASALHDARTVAATALAEAVTTNMHGLGMPGGRFDIGVDQDPDALPSPFGTDLVEFLVSANPGQPLQPLAKVASGGELSRISLAIQVIGARGSGVPTLVFDEVDVGIGGGVAEIVGQQLRRLGETRQVLCITHLPQVASQGVNHLQARKQTREDMTITHIDSLLGEHRVEEIARMLGGIEITAQTLAHAREMIERSQAVGE